MDQGGRQPGAGTAMAVASVLSVQTGAALATSLFSSVGPLGTVFLRLLGSSAVLLVLTSPWRVRWSRAELRTILLFGAVLVVMNCSVYLALDRLPLATVITLEFLGPLGVAVGTATTWRQRVWALPAAAGVVLLAGSLGGGDLLGVVAALTAAVAWASYILVSRRMGTSEHGLAGLCLAGVAGLLVMGPVAAAGAGSALLEPRTLLLGSVVGIVSSAIPYCLDLEALRRLPTAVFGVLTSLNPAVAALAGFLLLDQALPAGNLAGVVLVTVASVGISWEGARRSGPALAVGAA